MKLIGNLKKAVTKVQSGEEAKKMIRDTNEEAVTVLDDDELDKVSGGGEFTNYNINDRLM